MEEFPDWVKTLFKNATQQERRRAYYAHCLTDLTDDVDCSGSTLRTRSVILNYLAEQLDEATVIHIEKIASKVAEIIGYASGQPWREDQNEDRDYLV